MHKVIVGAFIICSMLLCSCAHKVSKERVIPLKYGDLKLDHDQIMICVYDHALGEIGCMSPEEYEVRREVRNDNLKSR